MSANDNEAPGGQNTCIECGRPVCTECNICPEAVSHIKLMHKGETSLLLRQIREHQENAVPCAACSGKDMQIASLLQSAQQRKQENNQPCPACDAKDTQIASLTEDLRSAQQRQPEPNHHQQGDDAPEIPAHHTRESLWAALQMAKDRLIAMKEDKDGIEGQKIEHYAKSMEWKKKYEAARKKLKSQSSSSTPAPTGEKPKSDEITELETKISGLERDLQKSAREIEGWRASLKKSETLKDKLEQSLNDVKAQNTTTFRLRLCSEIKADLDRKRDELLKLFPPSDPSRKRKNGDEDVTSHQQDNKKAKTGTGDAGENDAASSTDSTPTGPDYLQWWRDEVATGCATLQNMDSLLKDAHDELTAHRGSTPKFEKKLLQELISRGNKFVLYTQQVAESHNIDGLFHDYMAQHKFEKEMLTELIRRGDLITSLQADLDKATQALHDRIDDNDPQDPNGKGDDRSSSGGGGQTRGEEADRNPDNDLQDQNANGDDLSSSGGGGPTIREEEDRNPEDDSQDAKSNGDDSPDGPGAVNALSSVSSAPTDSDDETYTNEEDADDEDSGGSPGLSTTIGPSSRLRVKAELISSNPLPANPRVSFEDDAPKKELAELQAENKSLRSELEELKKQCGGESPQYGASKKDVRKLVAENKSLGAELEGIKKHLRSYRAAWDKDKPQTGIKAIPSEQFKYRTDYASVVKFLDKDSELDGWSLIAKGSDASNPECHDQIFWVEPTNRFKYKNKKPARAAMKLFAKGLTVEQVNELLPNLPEATPHFRGIEHNDAWLTS